MIKSFDKNVTAQMKSMAFFLMLIHHLWREPGFARYGALDSGYLLLSIGLMSKICVGIFMFISGYGLMNPITEGTKYSIKKRLMKSLPPFWLIVILSAPYLLINKYNSLCDIVTDGLLLTSKMNGSWWFMQTYVIFLILFPLFIKSLDDKRSWIIIFIVSLFCFQPLANELRQYSEALHYILYYFPLFYAGMITRKFSLFDKVAYKPTWIKFLLIFLAILSRFLTGWNILNICLVFVMIMVFLDIQFLIHNKVKQLFNFLGLMSMNMWLVHMFFIKYGYHITNPILDVFWIYIESLIIAYILRVIFRNVQKRIFNKNGLLE